MDELWKDFNGARIGSLTRQLNNAQAELKKAKHLKNEEAKI